MQNHKKSPQNIPLGYSRHHRDPQDRSYTPENISVVPTNLHAHWHAIFGNMTAQEICHTINETWLDSKYKLVIKENLPQSKPQKQWH